MNKIYFLIATLTLFVATSFAENDSRLMRYPDINGNLIAFSYAGDIWTVTADGGDAKRLTSHEGLELFPKISPDGKWIAFSGEYNGNRQVYVIPSEGGSPKQLTWYNSVGQMPPRGGFDNVILDWTPDSKQILFRANRTEFGDRNGKYFLVSLDGGLEQALPLVNGGMGVLSPDGDKLCFTPVDREFRSWKRYKGGRATDLWIYDLKKNHSKQITDFVGSDQWPVWYKEKIFFASDRDLKLNIYSYDINSKQIEQHTFFKEMDILWPSGKNGQLVFENDGFIHKMNLNTFETKKVTININFDNPLQLPYFKNVKDNIHSISISPTGKRALIDAEGDIFSVPAQNGIIENLTRTQGVREIYPAWSPNGDQIAYYSDSTGEYELYLIENNPNANPLQITFGSAAWKYQGVWSPNSRYFVYSDRTLQLKVVDMQNKKEVIADKATDSEIRDYSFSPDSRFITYSKESSNGQSAIWIYDIINKSTTQLTDIQFNDYNPVFSEDGNYIFFLSNRDFNLTFSNFEFNYLYNRATRVYAMILSKNGPKLFKDKEDIEKRETESKDVKTSTSQKEKAEKSEKHKEESKVTSSQIEIKIDIEDINNRITVLPMAAGNYAGLTATNDGLLYISNGTLNLYDIKEEKSKEIMSKVSMVKLSADKKMMLYRSGNDYGIVAVKPGITTGEGKLKLDDLTMRVEPEKEWKQIFNDAWRIFRDYFYVDNLHGVDWQGVRKLYEQWLPSVGHRVDLDHILSEMVSESNTGHAYINYGDFKSVERREGGLLGASLDITPGESYYRFTKIYQGENWNPDRRSPLTEPGVDVNEGDYLIAINDIRIPGNDNPYLYLENLADKQTRITVSANADGSNPRSSIIKPIKSELELLYLEWVNQRRELVDRLSKGRIGYIHVPNTSFEGNRELFRGMYAYHDKEALIIDDRYNGGGFIPDIMTGLLERKTLSYWQRNGLSPMQTPGVAHDGPKVMLINGYSSSGGDAFPYFFKKKNLGTLIGTRTWGGLVGISANAGLVDGGSLAVPRFGIYNEQGEWIIEGIGVYPDIEVVDRPEQLAEGVDPSIEKAVEVLLKQLKENPEIKIKAPAPPDRSGWIEENIE